MIREIDEDGNGEIDFDEFVQVASLPYSFRLPYVTPASCYACRMLQPLKELVYSLCNCCTVCI